MSLAEQGDGAGSRAAETFESTAPASGAVVGVCPVQDAEDVRAAVHRARIAAAAWADLGFDGRRTRLAAYRGRLARRVHELADLMSSTRPAAAADALARVKVLVHGQRR